MSGSSIRLLLGSAITAVVVAGCGSSGSSGDATLPPVAAGGAGASGGTGGSSAIGGAAGTSAHAGSPGAGGGVAGTAGHAGGALGGHAGVGGAAAGGASAAGGIGGTTSAGAGGTSASGGAGAGGTTAGGGGSSGSGGAPYPRTMTTRPTYGTSVNNLILDPFATADTSLGHFVAYSPTSGDILNFRRRIASSSPAGVSLPFAILDGSLGTTPDPSLARFAIYVETPGSAKPLRASIWVSASDSLGNAVPFATQSNSFLAELMLPDATGKVTLGLTGTNATIDGREWVQLGTPGTVSMPAGGLFLMLVQDASVFFVQAPEVIVDGIGMAEASVVKTGPTELSIARAGRAPEAETKRRIRHPGGRTAH